MMVLQSSADWYDRMFSFVCRIITYALVPISLAQSIYH